MRLLLRAIVTVVLCLSATHEGRVSAEEAQIAAPSAAEILTTARTVTVIGKTGKQLMDRGWANPHAGRAKEKVEAVLAAWGRYTIVNSTEGADLVVVITETQKNLSLLKRANLVAELKVYGEGVHISEKSPPLWSGEAAESFKKQPATKVAEQFRDFCKQLQPVSQHQLVTGRSRAGVTLRASAEKHAREWLAKLRYTRIP